MRTFNIISLGAGVQSSAMALMAAKGLITPMPDCAVFADVQAEPKSVYDWLDYLTPLLPFPVIKVSHGNLEEQSLKLRKTKAGHHYAKYPIPAYTLSPEGRKGMMQRHCTFDFKIVPIRKAIKKFIGKGNECVQWLGISVDEASRMKDSQIKYVKNRYPLIDLGMSRQDCLKWMENNRYGKPPRSACVFCPFKSMSEWKLLPDVEFQRAVTYEKNLQELYSKIERMREKPYLHNSRIPLEMVLKNDDLQGNLWGNECEGLCGV